MTGPRSPSSRPPPSPRPLRTLLAVIWERSGRWVVRARGDRLFGRVLGLGCLAGAAAGAAVVSAPLIALVVPGITILLMARFGRSTVFDWRGEQIVTADEVIPMDRVEGLAFETSLIINARQPPAAARQVWTIEVLRSGAAPAQIAAHGREYPLLRAARRLSAVLGVPVHDACGGDGMVTDWDPGQRRVASRPQPVRSAHAGEDALPEPEAARAETGPAGTELSWRGRWTSRVVTVAVSGGALVAGALYIAYANDRVALHGWHWALAGLGGLGGLFLAALFIGSFRIARSHGINLITVGSEVVAIRRPFPFPSVRRVRRADVLGVRLSARLLAPPEASKRWVTPRDRPRVAVTRLDLVGEHGRLLSLVLTPAEARWLAPRLRRALGEDAPA